jgi:hypothetical protein
VVQVAMPVLAFTDCVEQPVIVVPFDANDMVPWNGIVTEPALAATVAVKVTEPFTSIAAPAAVIVTAEFALLTVTVADPVMEPVTVSVAVTVWLPAPTVTSATPLVKVCTPWSVAGTKV